MNLFHKDSITMDEGICSGNDLFRFYSLYVQLLLVVRYFQLKIS